MFSRLVPGLLLLNLIEGDRSKFFILLVIVEPSTDIIVSAGRKHSPLSNAFHKEVLEGWISHHFQETPHLLLLHHRASTPGHIKLCTVLLSSKDQDQNRPLGNEKGRGGKNQGKPIIQSYKHLIQNSYKVTTIPTLPTVYKTWLF